MVLKFRFEGPDYDKIKAYAEHVASRISGYRPGWIERNIMKRAGIEELGLNQVKIVGNPQTKTIELTLSLCAERPQQGPALLASMTKDLKKEAPGATVEFLK